jgi:hypothetical protein
MNVRTHVHSQYLSRVLRFQATGAILSPKDVTDCSFLDASANWCDGKVHWAANPGKPTGSKLTLILAVAGGVVLCAIIVYLLVRRRRATSLDSNLLDYSGDVGTDGRVSGDLPPLPVL